MFGKLIKLDDGGYGVDAPYDQSKLSALQGLPGARWDGDLRVRRVSTMDDTLIELVEALDAIDVQIPDEIMDRAFLLSTPSSVPERDIDDRLFPFQVQGVKWLRQQTRALLGDQMGCGKTVQILQALPDKALAIIVVPATLKRNWLQETERWRPDLTPVILKGRKSFRWPEPGEVLITNYEVLPKDVPADCPQGIVMAADEAQRAKSPKAQRTKNLRALRDAVLDNSGRVWIATGTPLLNTPADLWHVLAAAKLNDKAFGGYQQFFRAFGGYHIDQWNGHKNIRITQWGKPTEEAAHMLGKVMLRRTREEVLPDLPGKRHRIIDVNGISRETKKLLDAGYETLDALLEDSDWESSPDEIPEFAEMSKAKALLARSKIEAMMKLVEDYEENEEPLVVFSDHLAPVEELGSRYGWDIITGSVSADKRQEIVDSFQAGRLRGIALTIPAGNYGLTLTRAHSMIFCDLNWVPANNVQAQDRICRIGQDRGCVYTTLVVDHPLDRRIHEILTTKMDLINQTVRTTAEINPSLLRTDEEAAKAVENIKARQEALRASEETETKEKIEDKAVEGVKCPACGKTIEVRISRSPKNLDRPYYSCRPCDWFQWADEEPMDEGLHDWVLSACRALARVCDGAMSYDDVGFNGGDTGFGKSLAAQARLSAKQVKMGRRMLMKYREQLSGMGTWPPPDFSDEGREAKVEFKRHGAGRYLIHVDHKAEGEIFKMQDGAWGARFKAGSAFSFSDAAANHSSLLKDLKNQVRETVKRNNSDQLSHEPEGDLNAQV